MQNEIVNKMAEWLQISVEKAVELYPQLRMEAVWYNLTTNLLYLLAISFAVSISGTFITWLDLDDYEEEQDKKRFKMFLRLSGVIGLLILLILTVSPFLYPNIVFFKEFVK